MAKDSKSNQIGPETLKANQPKTDPPNTALRPTPEHRPTLDETDWAILHLLQEDARLTFSEIGRRVHLSQPAVAERVRVLEEHGIITGYRATINSYVLGFPILAFISVAARTFRESEQVIALVRDIPEVLECHSITGDNGLLLRVIASSIARLDEIVHMIGHASAPTTAIVLHTAFEHRPI